MIPVKLSQLDCDLDYDLGNTRMELGFKGDTRGKGTGNLLHNCGMLRVMRSVYI